MKGLSAEAIKSEVAEQCWASGMVVEGGCGEIAATQLSV